MPDSMMYDEDMFVVLETNQPEAFLSPAEMLEKLQSNLKEIQDDLPPDLQGFDSIEAQAKNLLDTSCELDLGPDRFLQWYAVRLDKD